MHIVVDAQVVCGYYKETVLDIDSELTDDAAYVVERLGNSDRAYLDEGGQLEHEWSETVPSEWFDPWLARLLADGRVVEIPVTTCHQLRAPLRQLGFPLRGSRDFWYVRTARAVVDFLEDEVRSRRGPVAFLISEDMHFHDPREASNASGGRRIRVLRSGNGPVARYLLRRQRICVSCVANYRESAEM